jgi:hypothetical protein
VAFAVDEHPVCALGTVRSYRADEDRRPDADLGERHLRMTLAQYERHHNGRRLYRGRQLCLPGPITLRPASPGSGSKAPSAALSRGMSGPHREAQVRNDSRVLKLREPTASLQPPSDQPAISMTALWLRTGRTTQHCPFMDLPSACG